MVIIALAGIIGGVGYFNIKGLQEKIDEIAEEHSSPHHYSMMMIEARVHVGKLREYIINQMAGVTMEKRAEADFNSSMSRYHEHEEEMEKLSFTEESKQLLAETRKLHDDYDRSAREIMLFIEQGKVIESYQKEIEETELKADKYLASLTKLINYNDGMLKDAQSHAEHVATSAINLIITTTMIVIIFGLFIAFSISRSISKSISEVKSAAVEIARGNMDVEIDTSGKDEVAELSRAIDEMRAILRTVMEEYEKGVK